MNLICKITLFPRFEKVGRSKLVQKSYKDTNTYSHLISNELKYHLSECTQN